MITTEELIRDFSEENFAGWCRGKFADFVPKSERLDEGDFSRARQIGYVRTLADGGVNRPLLVAAVQVQGELGERSSRKRQFDFARKALQRAMDRPPGQAGGLFTQGLFVFYGDGGDFRMSLISGRVEGGKLAYNSFKRQTFFVQADPTIRNRTFRDQMDKGLGDYKALCDAFSIEALTKQFYNELFAWYEWALSDEMDVRYPNDIHTDKDNREMIPEHMIRLITRLMFVWFIKQKHLVPDEIFRVEELRKLLRDFDPDSETEGNYYNAILQNLFFATLNNKIEDREFAANGTTRAENENHYGVKTLFRNPKGGTWFKVSDQKIIELFEKVPFLNGGLFECLDRPEDEKSKRILYYDGFSREEKVKGKLTRAFVPNCLFFDKDNGLIPLFQRYNFTVEENSPNDAEVALDPELLGKVFENLLGAYNPETKETARKQSGSFYTPREIVSYMVDESLKQYLKTQVQIDDSVLAPLFDEDAKVELTAAAREKLRAAIKAVKILDPACGSGAFPMGALHRLVDLLVKLDGQTENLYDLKLHLIENCIYGVDIQTIAVQISKLRFFISLVCEQEPNNRKDNYGILPLPNLETKFVAANTLIGLEKNLAGDLNLEDEEIAKLRKELWDIRHRHFLSKSSQEKHACRRQDKAVRGKIQQRIVAIASTPDKGKIAHLEESIRKLEGEKSKYRGEKWETILVPKQGDLFGGESGNAAEKKRVDTNRAKREEIEGRIQLCERDIAAEKGKKISKELVAAAEKLAAWNPYDQNESSPFFDSEWMFGVKEGFSIVIGNPPYIDSELMKKNCPEFRDYLREQLKTTQGNWDLYIAFTETAFNLLSQNGFLSFITPNKWLSAPYGKALRGFLRACVTSVVDCSAVDVFEAGNTPIVFIISRSGVKDCKVYRFEKDYAIEHGTTVNTSSLSDDNWGHLLSRNISLNNKVATHTSTVGDLFIVENPFTTGEAYELCDILHEAHDVRRSQIFRFVNTGTIAKYRSLWGVRKTTYLKSHYENPVVPKHEFANAMPRRARQSERPKIIIKGIRYFDSFVDPDGSYIAGKSTIIVFHSSDAVLNLHWLSAILNSKLIMFLLRSAFSSLGIDGGINFSKDMVAGIRLPTLKLDDKRELAALAERAAKEDPMADISNIEGKINERVYRLYSLTSDEISIVEGACAAPKKSDNEITSRRPVKTKSKSALVDDEGLD